MALLACAALALTAYAWLYRRRRAVPETLTAAIDREASLGGELRSAAWFASRGGGDEWARFHITRAAERVQSIDFSRIYPAVRAPRARVTTGVLVCATLILALTFPQRRLSGTPAPSRPAPATRPAAPILIDGVPIELPKELEDLLAAIEDGTLSARRQAGDPAIEATLSKLQALKDAKALAALARAMAAERGDTTDDADAKMKDLADRAKRDAALSTEPEVRQTLDDLSKKLSSPEREMDSASIEKAEDPQAGSSVELSSSPSQSTREMDATASLGMMTLSKQEAAGEDPSPGVGVGGTSSAPGEAGTMAKITDALRHEIVEAHENDVSGDVHSDTRKKTERGSATATFTRSGAGSFDGSRAAAAPPVPETRRAGVQTYFTRKQ